MLNRKITESFYDEFGKKQDKQAYYEDPAIHNQLEYNEFSTAKHVFEFGCGTGRLAEKLLSQYLPEESWYTGLDLSSTMIDLSSERLAAFNKRIHLIKSTGEMKVPLPDNSVDRFISNYVLDILPPDDIHEVVNEAYRILIPSGTMSLISITNGITFMSKMVMNIWNLIFKIKPEIVGGCRPIELKNIIKNDTRWEMIHANVITTYGIASEIIVVRKKRH